jgi:hypothetical protein
MSFITPATIQKLSSAPSVGSEGTLYYNTTTDKLYLSNGTAWLAVDTNSPPTPTGGTVTIPTQVGNSTFSYNLGLNFSDSDSTDAELIYTLQSGTLPAGAVLPTSGNTALTGTATNQATATYNFVIKATDSGGSFGTQAYTQVITPAFNAAGGTITTPTGYKVHTFTSSGTFTPEIAGTVEYLVVAGGGGGGAPGGGGGGAGGYRTASSFAVAATGITITVGAAGNAGIYNVQSGQLGGNSVFSTITSLGGGGGGGNSLAALAGGSGGGKGGSAGAGSAGTSGQGNNGGSCSGYGYGGGGGAGAVGGNGSNASGGGVGGIGTQTSINGTATYFAGGGGGGTYVAAGTSAGRTGGLGGGGTGGNQAAGLTGGTANTGGGGGGRGGGTGAGTSGGSGIVIIRYAV